MAKPTDQFVRSLQVPEGAKDVQALDDTCPGFGVRKQASGHTTFFVKYSIGKQQRRRTLGPFVPGVLAGIRKQAVMVLAQARLGTDVVGDARKARQEAEQAKTMGELVPVYLALREKGDEFWKKLRPRSLEEVTRFLKKSWQPLHDVAVTEITRQRVKERRNEIVHESGAVSANRALCALSSFFGWVIDQEHITGSNPTLDIKPLHEEDRSRVLGEAELVDIWLACGDDAFGHIVKLLMLTGQRRSEIGGLRWSEIDLHTGQINLPGERTKNGHPHFIPLSEPVRAILEQQPHLREQVFGRGDSAEGFAGWSAATAALRAALPKMESWTLHDLRRTMATGMGELGVQPHIIEAAINHQSGHKAGVAGTYNRANYHAERKVALDKWAAHVMALVTKRPFVVVAKAA